MHIPRQRPVRPLVPTVSMANIAFLLIIFFLVTTVHEVDRTRVKLPFSRVGAEAQKNAAVVVLTRDDRGEYVYRFTDGEAMSSAVAGPEDIYLEASKLSYTDPSRQFVLKADGSIEFEKIDELLDQMRRGGVQNVLLLTQPQTEKLP